MTLCRISMTKLAGFSANGAIYEFADEGITWISGHHTPDSAPAQALLAAYLLSLPASASSP